MCRCFRFGKHSRDESVMNMAIRDLIFAGVVTLVANIMYLWDAFSGGLFNECAEADHNLKDTLGCFLILRVLVWVPLS